MSEVQPFKAVSTTQEGKESTTYFVDRALNPALKQVKAFIERNKHIKVKVFYKDWSSQFNFGWKYFPIT